LGINCKYGRDYLGVKKWQKVVLVAKFPTKHFCDGKNITDIYFLSHFTGGWSGFWGRICQLWGLGDTNLSLTWAFRGEFLSHMCIYLQNIYF
jgi:hypothetical protein